MQGITTTEFIENALRQHENEEWDTKVLLAALEWNRAHYKLPDDLVKEMYTSLKGLESRLQNMDIDSRYGDEQYDQ